MAVSALVSVSPPVTLQTEPERQRGTRVAPPGGRGTPPREAVAAKGQHWAAQPLAGGHGWDLRPLPKPKPMGNV